MDGSKFTDKLYLWISTSLRSLYHTYTLKLHGYSKYKNEMLLLEGTETMHKVDWAFDTLDDLLGFRVQKLWCKLVKIFD